MRIVIHSSGRANRQITLPSLLSAHLEPELLVQDSEFDEYHKFWGYRCLITKLPPEINRLSPTRQWIIDNTDGKVVMMDDDLRFCARRTDDWTKFNQATNSDVREMFHAIGCALDEYAHAGVVAREGGNRIEAFPYVFNTRMMRLLAYNADKVRAVGARFDRIITKQDFDMTLQLLRAGYPNALLTKFCHDQPGSNTSGGCSAYRSPEVMDDSARKLAELHPGFVKVVQKTTKGAWGGGVRTDVQIQWKKAYDSSSR